MVSTACTMAGSNGHAAVSTAFVMAPATASGAPGAPTEGGVAVEPQPWDGKQPLRAGHVVAAQSVKPKSKLKGNVWYRADVVRTADTRVLLHFHGWNRRFDEWQDSKAGTIATVDALIKEEGGQSATVGVAGPMDPVTTTTSEVKVSTKYIATCNGYLLCRSGKKGLWFDAFYCVPLDSLPALVHALPNPRAVRIFIGTFASKMAGLHNLQDNDMIEKCFRIVLAGRKCHRTLPCTQCNAPFDVACLAKAPRVACWACETCDAAVEPLAHLFPKALDDPTSIIHTDAPPLDCKAIEQRWLAHDAAMTHDLHVMQQEVATMKEMAVELRDEYDEAVATLAEVQATHHGLQRQHEDLAVQSAERFNALSSVRTLASKPQQGIPTPVSMVAVARSVPPAVPLSFGGYSTTKWDACP
eukprot:m.216410 g.216410  ORF g.216410 m.216410 type:complete len:413 (+) comp28348_c0_seq1:3-1241(+)